MNAKTPQTNRTRAAKPAEKKLETAITESGNTSLATRIESKRRSKSGQLRRIWPEIKAALKDGYQLKVVWECLVEGGIDLSWPKFRTYISKLRRTEAAGVDLPTAVPARQEFALASQQHQQHSLKRDPLANLKNHLGKRPGFEFDERPPDEKKLF